MHTVRNRLAQSSRKRAKRRGSSTDRAFMLRQDARLPPMPSTDLIVQPGRPVPMGRKAARKAARRAAALARADAAPPTAPALLAAASSQIDVPMAPEPAEMLDPEVPLPSSRALVQRRQGLIDMLAFALRDSGRRLSRWSSARRRADDMKDKLARAEARMHAMEAQLAALQALQERVRPIRLHALE